MSGSRTDPAAKVGLATRLLGTDSTLGIVAGLTALVSATQNHESNNEVEENDGCAVDTRRKSVDDKAKKNIKATARGSADFASPLSPDRGGGETPSPSPLSSSAKKYSVQEQRDVIRKLQERNQLLKQELSIEIRDAKQLLAQEKRQRVEYLQKTTEAFTKKVEIARKTVAKLDEQIAKKEQELDKLRQQQYLGTGKAQDTGAGATTNDGVSPAVGETSASMARRVRSLENRLELTLVKRNEMDSINKHLKAQIDKVRKDRVIFDGIYKKLEKELSDFQSRYDSSVEELKKATEAKDQVTHEIQQIQTRAELEQRQYEAQFKDLRLQIEAVMREIQERKDTMGVAPMLFGKEDTTVCSNALSVNTVGDSGLVPNGAAQTVSGVPESPLKRITALSSWKIGFDKALASTSDSIVAKFDQAFDGIKKMTGITDITRIAEAIMLKDEENFKRFKHVEELHREEAALKAQVEQLTQEIEEFKAKEGIATGTTQKQQYRILEAKYHLVLEKNKAFDVEFEETTNKLTRVKSSIHSIHSMLVHANCAKNADQFSLNGGANLTMGSHSARDITDSNVLEYLQAIEIFTSSLMKETHEATAAANAAAATAAAINGGSLEAALAAHSNKHSATEIASSSSTASPIGHGPSTMSSDPAQKLRVQVPSFGGVNGVIILPASTNLDSPTESQASTKSNSKLHLQQQQQRKKTSRFELSSRKSLSQQQFAAALAAASTPVAMPSTAASMDSVRSLEDSATSTPGTSTAQTPVSSSHHHTVGTPATLVEEDEEERAYTYEELRDFAAKHIVKKREDPAAVRIHTAHGGGLVGSASSSPTKPRNW